jgi:hypothetical protein
MTPASAGGSLTFHLAFNSIIVASAPGATVPVTFAGQPPSIVSPCEATSAPCPATTHDAGAFQDFYAAPGNRQLWLSFALERKARRSPHVAAARRPASAEYCHWQPTRPNRPTTAAQYLPPRRGTHIPAQGRAERGGASRVAPPWANVIHRPEALKGNAVKQFRARAGRVATVARPWLDGRVHGLATVATVIARFLRSVNASQRCLKGRNRSVVICFALAGLPIQWKVYRGRQCSPGSHCLALVLAPSGGDKVILAPPDHRTLGAANTA